MQLDRYVNTLGQHLRQRFGERVHKLPLHAGFSCPNRDGTIGVDGCSFCNVGAFNHESEAPLDEQLCEGRERLERAQRYLAYFQSYTNTYAEVARLRELYDEALASHGVVGLCIGTRPDCVSDEVLDLLAGYREQGSEIWLELGLQSACDETLRRVNRGHGFAAFAKTCARARERSLQVCAHLIVGLPGERAETSLMTLDRVLEQGVAGLKLHPLMVMRGSRLAREYASGVIAPLSFEAYVEIAAELIRLTPGDIVYHRVAASARQPMLIAPTWCGASVETNNAIGRELAANGAQGCKTERPYEPAEPTIATGD